MKIPIIRERKFTASCEMKSRALSILHHHCLPDPNHPAGFIKSVYYDTYHLKSFKEKIEGDNLKSKVRMRWYEDVNSSDAEEIQAFIEIKYRIGAARQKIRHMITVSGKLLGSAPLEDIRFIELLYNNSPEFGALIPLDLVPVVCISYERQRFICQRSGGGICLDMNIQGSRFNSNLFQATNAVRSNMIVCEFKDSGLEDLPLAEELYLAGFKLRSFSKYGECVSQVLLGGAPQFLARHVI